MSSTPRTDKAYEEVRDEHGGVDDMRYFAGTLERELADLQKNYKLALDIITKAGELLSIGKR